MALVLSGKAVLVLFIVFLSLPIVSFLAGCGFVTKEHFNSVILVPSLPYALDDSIELASFSLLGVPQTNNKVLWTEISREEADSFGLSFQGVGEPIGNLDVDITGVSIYLPGEDAIDIPVSTLEKRVTNKWCSPARGRDFSKATAEETGEAFVYIGGAAGESAQALGIPGGFYFMVLPDGERGSVEFSCQLPPDRRVPLRAGTVFRLYLAVKGERQTRNHVLDLKVEGVDERVETKHGIQRAVESF